MQHAVNVTAGGAVSGRRSVNAAACSAGRPREPAAERAQVLDQLGRLVDLEVDAEHRDPQREPSEVVVAGRYSQLRASIGSIVPQWAGTRPAISSAAAWSVTRAS